MSIAPLVPFALLVAALPSVALAGATPADPVAARLERELAAMHCPGAACAWLPDDAPARRWVLGHQDAARRLPMRADLRFPLGSVSKLFVGNLVLQLADEGLVDLDAPFSRYAPGILPPALDPTVHDLGRHTGGLPDPIASRAFQAQVIATPAKAWTAGELLAWAGRLPAPPSGKFHYSNLGTVALARVVERAAGAPFDTVLRDRLLDPLGLAGTRRVDASGIPAPHARGYRHQRKGNPLGYGRVFAEVTAFSPSWAGEGGDLVSTLGDLERAARWLCDGENLSPASRAEQRRFGPADTPHMRYGFHLMELEGGMIGHLGDVPGWSAVLARLPAKRAIVIVLANLSNTRDGRHPATVLAQTIADHAP